MDQELNIRIHTFGCKVNTYDSGLLQQGLKTSYPKPVHIVNTCAVTAEATREALRLVKKLKRENPQSMVVVTGCSAQVDTEKFTELCEADLVVANSHKSQLAKILEDYFDGRASSKVLKSNIFLNSDLGAGGGTEEEHTRAFLKIQDGCNSFCTYCVIPFARGRSRSIPVRQLVERIQELQRSGTKEVVITGVHIADYEDDGLYLDDLIETILRETAIPRLRLSSLEPREITDRLLELWQDPRMCSSFHLSVQSASDPVLRAMKRRYLSPDIFAILRRIEKQLPDAFVAMDIITGFPGETESMHRETFDLLSDAHWTRLHVFPYSERPGTKALQLEGVVPRGERKRRAAELREMSLGRWRQKAQEQIGRNKKILVLNSSQGIRGLSRDYWDVVVTDDVQYASRWRGQEIDVRITGLGPERSNQMEPPLLAEVVL